ncbi:MAG TPA: hypothetical protein VFJ90_03605, partial [Candidatus Didemnitutus sp.]|nr:hypothetical protein [Candidatus Didemnitutus sp.]
MSRTRHPYTTAWRFCLSCCLTLGCWALWLALGFLLAVQAYVALAKDVPVPDFVLRRIERQFAQANLDVRFGKVQFDPGGELLFENVRLLSRTFDEPLAVIRSVYVKKSFWSMLAGQTVPDEVRVEGAMIQLPALLSPSGTTEALIRDASLSLHYADDLWHVDQLNFRVANLPVTARGEIAPPKKVPGAPSLSIEEMIARYRQLGRQLALRLPELQACEAPLLDLQFQPSAAGGIQLSLHFAAAGIHRPAGQPVEIGEVTASGGWVWDAVRPRTLHIAVEAESLEYRDRFSARNVQGEFVLFPGGESLSFDRVHGSVTADTVAAAGEEFLNPVLTGTYSWPDRAARADIAFSTYGKTLELGGTADLQKQSARVELSGPVPPELVTSLLTRYGPKLEPYFRFGDPVDLHAEAQLDPGWKFAGLSTRVKGGRLDSRGVLITGVRGRIDVDAAMNFLAYDALLQCGDNYARGSYWMNFSSMNYRMLLTGQLRPPAISGWFRGDWWPDFWANFAFPTKPPTADVDVQGCWRNATNTSYFGSTDAVNATVLGATFEKVHTRVFVRPQFAHAFDIAAERAGGTQRGSGWFKRFADNETHTMSAWEYDLTANLDAESYRQMGKGIADKLLIPWRFTTMPDVHFRGRTDYAKDGGAVTKLTFAGHTDKPAWFYGFPVDNLAVTGALNGSNLTLDKIDFSVVGGQAHANASLTGSPAVLGFDAEIKGADLSRTIRTIETWQAEREGTKPGSMADSKVIKRASGGRLDVALSAQGSPDNLTHLNGNGNMQLTGSELGEVHLFGVLSQVLSAVWL